MEGRYRVSLRWGIHARLHEVPGMVSRELAAPLGERLAGDTAREATSDEVKELKAEARQLKETLAETGIRERSATKRTPPALPEIVPEASATVCAPLVVSLPWRVTARCPIVDPDLPPGRSAIPVLVAAMVLSARRLLRFFVLGRSNSVMRLRRVRGRDRCLAGPRWVALGVSAGGEKRRVDAARRWSGAAAESNGSDCWAIVRHPNHARLAQLDGNT